MKPTLDLAVCILHGHRVVASWLADGRINIDVDGWSLVGNVRDPIREIRELIQLRHPNDTVIVPDEFIDALSVMRDPRP